jgi:hypothetical protein
MSIAGIAKEVTTITISAWLFDDELTPLNITGVAITVCGTSRASVAGVVGYMLTSCFRYRAIHLS